VRAPALLALLCCAAASLPPSGAAAKRILPGFRSPSGNIRCYYQAAAGAAILRCQIGRADYAKRLTDYCGSTPIGVDWGGFELTATHKGSVTCTGGVLYEPDRERPVYVDLPYGKTFQRGVFTCVSRTRGVTCRSRSGHGLFVARERFSVW
jgi:hypothetical protein